MTRTLRVSNDLYWRVTDLARISGATAADALSQLLADSDVVLETTGSRDGSDDEAKPVAPDREGAGSPTRQAVEERPESVGVTATSSGQLARVGGEPEQFEEASGQLALGALVGTQAGLDTPASPASLGTNYAPGTNAQVEPGPAAPKLLALLDRLRRGTSQGRRLAAWIDTQLVNRT